MKLEIYYPNLHHTHEKWRRGGGSFSFRCLWWPPWITRSFATATRLWGRGWVMAEMVVVSRFLLLLLLHVVHHVSWDIYIYKHLVNSGISTTYPLGHLCLIQLLIKKRGFQLSMLEFGVFFTKSQIRDHQHVGDMFVSSNPHGFWHPGRTSRIPCFLVGLFFASVEATKKPLCCVKLFGWFFLLDFHPLKVGRNETRWTVRWTNGLLSAISKLDWTQKGGGKVMKTSYPTLNCRVFLQCHHDIRRFDMQKVGRIWKFRRNLIHALNRLIVWVADSSKRNTHRYPVHHSNIFPDSCTIFCPRCQVNIIWSDQVFEISSFDFSRNFPLLPMWWSRRWTSLFSSAEYAGEYISLTQRVKV